MRVWQQSGEQLVNIRYNWTVGDLCLALDALEIEHLINNLGAAR